MGISFAQNSNDNIETEIDSGMFLSEIQAPSIEVNGFDYSFKNDKDSLTLKPFKTGRTTITWEDFGTDKAIFRYRPLG